MSRTTRPTVLVVLDGWGMRPETSWNAIHQAVTPHFSDWWQHRPHALVETCAGHVGLPDGQMGNSEVGHTNLGAGRIVYQDYTRINRAIAEGHFASNKALQQTIQTAIDTGGAVHIMGLFSPGGVHSHTDHLLAAVRAVASRGVQTVWIHAFLDGRDTPPRSALEYVTDFERQLQAIGAGRIASVCGRYYAMDRDKRWQRVERAYDLLTRGIGAEAATACAAIEAAYQRGEDDEFVQPTIIRSDGMPVATLADGDVVLMMNFRADRAREIGHALLDPVEGEPAFKGFVRQRTVRLAAYFCLTLHDETLSPVQIGFPPEPLTGIIGEELSRHGLRQLRAAETEKYAHVTYFFNGGLEAPFQGEDRLLIPSPKVATYDLQPEMAAHTLTDELLVRLQSGGYDFMVINYANPDMVGHTGHFDAAIQAIETVDRCLGRLAQAVLSVGGELVITADHGNADCMKAEDGQPHTAHTNSPAPLIYIGPQNVQLKNGRLCDVAPTLLQLMGLPQPPQMTGRSLIATS
ncbi:MAG: 2,3-bisphosphoglycerate-independent phosphoglycerate mutase [Magnetococcales bacterium]|nr:2,3-bisphosphoglycerate-independent phosphoglycerate mutase [Magnetococcales bacterium]